MLGITSWAWHSINIISTAAASVHRSLLWVRTSEGERRDKKKEDLLSFFTLPLLPYSLLLCLICTLLFRYKSLDQKRKECKREMSPTEIVKNEMTQSVFKKLNIINNTKCMQDTSQQQRMPCQHEDWLNHKSFPNQSLQLWSDQYRTIGPARLMQRGLCVEAQRYQLSLGCRVIPLSFKAHNTHTHTHTFMYISSSFLE